MPTFIVLVVLGDGGPRYFAKHVWTSLMGAWLKLAREADAAGRTEANLQRVSIAFGDEDEQTGQLLRWIEEQIASVPAPYAAKKTALFETIGFGQSRGTAKMTLKVTDQQDLLDLQLGLKPHFEASRFVFRSERFGISAGQPEIDLSDVRISLTPEGRDVLLRATFPRGGSVAVAAKLYGAEAQGAFAWRVTSQCLDIVHGPQGNIRATAHLRADERASVEELALLAQLQASSPGARIFLEIEFDGRSIDIGSIAMEGQDEASGWPWLGLSLDTVRQVAAAANKPIPPIALAGYQKAAWELEILCALASERLMLLDFTPSPGIPPTYAAMLAYSWAEIDETVVGVVARRPVVDDRKAKGRRKIGFGTARILHGFVGRRSDRTLEAIERAYARQLEIMANEGDILALGDLRIVAGGAPGDRPLKSDLPERGRRKNSRSSSGHIHKGA